MILRICFTWCNFHINSIPYHQVFVPTANIFKALSSRLQMIALFARFSKELFNKKLENFNWSSLWKILLYDSTEGLLNTLNKLWQKKYQIMEAFSFSTNHTYPCQYDFHIHCTIYYTAFQNYKGKTLYENTSHTGRN